MQWQRMGQHWESDDGHWRLVRQACDWDRPAYRIECRTACARQIVEAIGSQDRKWTKPDAIAESERLAAIAILDTFGATS